MITGIVLASGFSRRMNRNKLALTIEGIPMIERVILAGVNSNLDEMLIIYRDPSVKTVADQHKIKSVHNNNAIAGQSESIKLGINNSDGQSEAYLFLMGDQPFITAEIINQILQAHLNNKKNIVVPLYDGKKGSPVLFPDRYKEKLLAIKGDSGGRALIMDENNRVHYENIQDKRGGWDIDTWDEYLQIDLLAKEGNQNG